jgi:hypothetical protein
MATSKKGDVIFPSDGHDLHSLRALAEATIEQSLREV